MVVATLVAGSVAGCIPFIGVEPCPTQTFSTSPAGAITAPATSGRALAVGACPASVLYDGNTYFDSRLQTRRWLLTDTQLTKVGTATAIGSPPINDITDGTVFQIADVAPERAIAMHTSDGHIVVLYDHLWPELCPYLAPSAYPPAECGAPTAS